MITIPGHAGFMPPSDPKEREIFCFVFITFLDQNDRENQIWVQGSLGKSVVARVQYSWTLAQRSFHSIPLSKVSPRVQLSCPGSENEVDGS